MLNFLDYLAEATKDNKGIKIVVVQGSPRTKKSCSGGDSKTEYLMREAIKSLPNDVSVDVLNLSVLDDQPQVRPCKGCIGTANGFQCNYPCNCYSPGDGTNDFMHEKGVYKKLEKADGFAVFTPVHWSSCSSQVKAMFDRLVCVNLTLTVDDAKKILGDDVKNPTKTVEAELSGKYKDKLKNHYEGKVGAFFIHGDDGADDYVGKKMPLSLIEDGYINPKQAIMPLVMQCRYSGIFVPDNCIMGTVFGYKEPYSQNNKDFKESDLIDKSVKLINNLVDEIKKRKSQ